MTKPLPPGTIYRGRNQTDPNRVNFCNFWVALPENERRLLGVKNASTKHCEGSGTDVLEVIGRLPPDRLDATEWREEYRLPEDYDPERHNLWWVKNLRLPKGGWFAHKPGRSTAWPLTDGVAGWRLVQPARPTDNRDGDYSTKDGRLLAPAPGTGHYKGERDALKKLLATERRAREAAEQKVTDLCHLRDKQMTEVYQDFRAATGQDYKPGHDWSMVDLDPNTNKFLKTTTGHNYEPGRDYSDPPQQGPVPTVKFVNDYLKGRYGVPNTPPEALKEAEDMSASTVVRFAKTRFLAKYASLFVLFSALSNPTDLWQSAVNWWTAPTALELGDWTRVHTCSNCNAVSSAVNPGMGETLPMCKKCGGETFTERKAQELSERTEWYEPGPTGLSPRGHVFPDGTTTLEPGHWLVPERTVEVAE